MKVFPEISGPRNESGGRAGAPAAWIGDERAIRSGQVDFDSDLDGLIAAAAVVEEGLLRTVVADVAVGEQRELRERSEKNDGRNVRPGLRRGKMPGVLVEETCDGSIMALAEEVGFADGFVGEGSVESRGEQRFTKNQEQTGDETNEVMHQDFPKISITLIRAATTAE